MFNPPGVDKKQNQGQRFDNDRPLISIVTVVFNDASNIEKTIQSVLSQSYENIEYIIVDGGSTDGTLDIIRKHDKDIDLWISEPDKGLYDAMNKAIGLATGEWINFQNSNDWFHNNSTISDIFSSIPKNYDFIYGHYVYEWIGEKRNSRTYIEASPLDTMWQKISFSHQSLFSKTALMKKHKFNLRYNIVCDYEFYFSHYVKGHTFHNADIFISIISGGGISHVNLWKRTIERWKVVRKYYNSPKVTKFYLQFIYENIIEPYFAKFKKNRFTPYLKKIFSKFPKETTTKNKPAQVRALALPNQNFLITIVVPNFNNEKYLRSCLTSIQDQTYKNIEILIVDDCSTDSSKDILETFKGNDSRIRVIYNPANKGVSSNRHNAILEAQGEYITTLDSDDFLITPEKLEKEMCLIHYFLRKFNKDIIAYSDVMLANENGQLLSYASRNHPTLEGHILEGVITRQCMIPRDFLFSKKLYFESGGYDTDIPIYEDWDLKIRLAAQHEFYYTGVAGIGYRRHGQGLSNASPVIHGKWLQHILSKNISLVDISQRQKIECIALKTIGHIAREN